MKLQVHIEKHHQNTELHGSQQVLQNPGLSFAKNAEIEYTICAKQSQVSNPDNDSENT